MDDGGLAAEEHVLDALEPVHVVLGVRAVEHVGHHVRPERIDVGDSENEALAVLQPLKKGRNHSAHQVVALLSIAVVEGGRPNILHGCLSLPQVCTNLNCRLLEHILLKKQ